MPTVPEAWSPIEPRVAAGLVRDLGFLASSDFPDRPGPAWLIVALRAMPTLRHYDPEAIEYWTTAHERGLREVLTRSTPVPVRRPFSWGLIRISDRLHVTNEFLSFGGTLVAGRVDDAVVAAFTSPAPLLRRGGHSQLVDPAAESLGAWYGRLLFAVDVLPGFEARVAALLPVARYAAFLADELGRYRAGPLRDAHPELASMIWAEAGRVALAEPAAWAAGHDLRSAMATATRSASAA